MFLYTYTFSNLQFYGLLSSKHIPAPTSFTPGTDKFKQHKIQQILPWDDRSDLNFKNLYSGSCIERGNSEELPQTIRMLLK